MQNRRSRLIQHVLLVVEKVGRHNSQRCSHIPRLFCPKKAAYGRCVHFDSLLRPLGAADSPPPTSKVLRPGALQNGLGDQAAAGVAGPEAAGGILGLTVLRSTPLNSKTEGPVMGRLERLACRREEYAGSSDCSGRGLFWVARSVWASCETEQPEQELKTFAHSDPL